jgi:hypothetical protein
MAKSSEKFDPEAALADPGAVFAKPQAIVDDSRLLREAKIELVQQWKHDGRGLSITEYKGMTGGEESMLGRVQRALHDLGVGESPKQTTRHGG